MKKIKDGIVFSDVIKRIFLPEYIFIFDNKYKRNKDVKPVTAKDLPFLTFALNSS